MKDRWSSPICDRFLLRISNDLQDWFDRGWDQFESSSEFNHYSVVPSLTEDAPQHFWPGFMLPDTMPIVGNRFGDWLCARIDEEGKVSEVIQWYHGGGDFIPYGSNLPEALFYDYCQSSRQDHATWGESTASEGKESILEWIAEHLPETRLRLEEIVSLFQQGAIQDGLRAFEEKGWSRAAVARDRIDLALSTPLRQMADPKLAMRLGVPWESEMTRWLFDTDTIPPEMRQRLEELLGPEALWLQQDWSIAEEEAKKVSAWRSDLGWAWDIGGWGAYRRGDLPEAHERWWRGLDASVFSDQSTRLRSHWFDRKYGKFSASQLVLLGDSVTPDQQMDPYWSALMAVRDGEAHHRVTSHWIGRASQIDLSAASRYGFWYRAGWDVGCQQVELFDVILANLESNAKEACWHSRAQLAATYRKKLGSRFRFS